MRKYLFYSGALTLLITLFSIQKLAAQNTFPYWSFAGNSNASSTTSKLGTTNAINLRLFTNNVERVHINYSNGYVGIGTTAPTYKLHVANTANAIYGYTTGTTSVGVWGRSPYKGVQGQGGTFGVYGTGTNGMYGSGTSRGVWGSGPTAVYGTSTTTTGFGIYGVGGSSGKGVYGEGLNGVYGVGQEAIYGHSNVSNGDAVYGIADGGSSAWGGNFNSTTSYGIYASTDVSGGIAGYFNGNVFANGTYQGSDRKLKQNITDVNNAMDIISKLQPKYYEYRQDGNFKQMNLPLGKHYGLIAQDVEQVLPGLVKETEFISKPIKIGNEINPVRTNSAPSTTSQTDKIEVTSFKALNYTELIPIMVKAMQEMNTKNEELEKKNNELEKKNNDLEARLKRLEDIVGKNVLAGNGGYSLDASLDQNTPNPFNSATIIRYHVPTNVASAKVVITDMSGKTIKSISLSSRGDSQLTLSSGTLAAGSYNYTLWVDGKQVDSKKMVITK